MSVCQAYWAQIVTADRWRTAFFRNPHHTAPSCALHPPPPWLPAQPIRCRAPKRTAAYKEGKQPCPRLCRSHHPHVAALRRVAAGKRVLDLGVNSGLLPILAAQVGASKVLTAEGITAGQSTVPHVKHVVAENSLEGSIEVVPQDSIAAGVEGAFEGAKAQLVTCEILAALPLAGELAKALEALQDSSMVEPGSTMLPCAARLFVAPVEVRSSHAHCLASPHVHRMQSLCRSLPARPTTTSYYLDVGPFRPWSVHCKRGTTAVTHPSCPRTPQGLGAVAHWECSVFACPGLPEQWQHCGAPCEPVCSLSCVPCRFFPVC